MTQSGASNWAWWGAFSIPIGECRHWRVGPLSLWILRGKREWRIAHERREDALDAALRIATPAAENDIPETAELARFAFARPDDDVHLFPIHADRPIVVSPYTSFSLLPGEEVTLFVSCPLWLRIEVGDPPIFLEETPVYRPSDTWFGPSTMEGELCYASKTGARLELENLPLRPHRVATSVRIDNRARTKLYLERLRLPMPNLSIYATTDGQLWTQGATLVRDEDGEMASLGLDDGPPREARSATRLTGPRESVEKGLLVRTFGGLLSFGR